jgi:nucleotide-binding universal stress UspA family protein
MFKSIVVTLDGTPTSNAGLDYALDLARDQGAKLVGLHVIDDRAVLSNLDEGHLPTKYVDRMYAGLRKQGEAILARAKTTARAAGVDLTPLLSEARGRTVPHAILAQVKKSKADVLVMGTHGRRGLSRMLLGSDAEAVLREAAIPVLLVRSAKGAKRKPAGVTKRAPKAAEAKAPNGPLPSSAPSA